MNLRQGNSYKNNYPTQSATCAHTRPCAPHEHENDHRKPKQYLQCVQDGIGFQASPLLQTGDVRGQKLIRQNNQRFDTLQIQPSQYTAFETSLVMTYHDNGQCIRSRSPPAFGKRRYSSAGKADDENNQNNLKDVDLCLVSWLEPTTVEEGLDSAEHFVVSSVSGI